MNDGQELLRKNTRLFYAITFLEYSYFNDAIYVLFGKQRVHLDYFQAGSLFFIGWFVSIALDFWGGVVADKIGRKRAQMYGLSIQLLAFLPYLFSRSYLLLALASALWGVGLALSSNTLHALIYEQATLLKTKRSYMHINAISQVWLFTGVALATILGGYAYTVDPRLPYGLMIITLSSAIILNRFIRVPDSAERALISKESQRTIARTALNTFRNNKLLLNFVIISFLAGIFGDLLFAYYLPYYINLRVGAVTLGILLGCNRLASGLGSYAMRVLPDKVTPQTIQLLNLAAMLVTAILLLRLKLPIVLAAPIFFGVTSGFVEPNMRLYINKSVSNEARASALSFGSMALSFGQGIGYVTAFYLADVISSKSVLLAIILGAAGTIAISFAIGSNTARNKKEALESVS